MRIKSGISDEKTIEIILNQVSEAKERLNRLGDRIQDFSALSDILEAFNRIDSDSSYSLDPKTGLDLLKNEEGLLNVCQSLCSYLKNVIPNVNGSFEPIVEFDPDTKNFSININDQKRSLPDLNDALTISDAKREIIMRNTASTAYITLSHGYLPDLGYSFDTNVYFKEAQNADDREKIITLAKKIANDYVNKDFINDSAPESRLFDMLFSRTTINKLDSSSVSCSRDM